MTDDRIGRRVTQTARRTLPSAWRIPGTRPGFGLDDAHVVVLVVGKAHPFFIGVRKSSLVFRHILVRVVVGIGVVLAVTLALAVVAVRVYASPVPSKEQLDIGTHLEILDITRKTLPGQLAVVESLLDERSGPEVYVVDEVVERRGIGDREMNDGVRTRRRRQNARESKRGRRRLTRQRRGRRRSRVYESLRRCVHDELEWRCTAKETSEQRGMRTEVVHVQLIEASERVWASEGTPTHLHNHSLRAYRLPGRVTERRSGTVFQTEGLGGHFGADAHATERVADTRRCLDLVCACAVQRDNWRNAMVCETRVGTRKEMIAIPIVQSEVSGLLQ